MKQTGHEVGLKHESELKVPHQLWYCLPSLFPLCTGPNLDTKQEQIKMYILANKRIIETS